MEHQIAYSMYLPYTKRVWKKLRLLSLKRAQRGGFIIISSSIRDLYPESSEIVLSRGHVIRRTQLALWTLGFWP